MPSLHESILLIVRYEALHKHYKKIFFIPDNNDNSNDETKEQINLCENLENEYLLIVFDASISFEWCSFLTNYLDENNKLSLHDGDSIDLSKKKLVYETTTLSRATPSFITKQNIISFDYDSFDWLNICYAYLDTNYKTSKNEELKLYIKGLFENYLPKPLQTN